jgi:hypothetical protein
MKQLLFFFFSSFITLTVSSQILKTGEAVEVDILLADTVKNNWKKATVVGYDSVAKVYKVKILDGDKMDIPSRDPEKWIRPVVDRNLMIKYGPGAKLPFQRRLNVIKSIDCRPSEKYIRKNLSSMMASEWKDFEFIYVDITTVKPQKTEKDPKKADQEIYPYKIEMLVHLKRTVLMGGRLYTEFQTWEYDREYAYAPKGKRICEFYPLQLARPNLISRGWFAQGW